MIVIRVIKGDARSLDCSSNDGCIISDGTGTRTCYNDT